MLHTTSNIRAKRGTPDFWSAFVASPTSDESVYSLNRESLLKISLRIVQNLMPLWPGKENHGFGGRYDYEMD